MDRLDDLIVEQLHASRARYHAPVMLDVRRSCTDIVIGIYLGHGKNKEKTKRIPCNH